MAAPVITRESLIPAVLTLFPGCHDVFDRHGGFRSRDGWRGPDQPVGWFARLRGVSEEELLQELNEAARENIRGVEEVSSLEPYPQSVEIFLRYGFLPAAVTPLHRGKWTDRFARGALDRDTPSAVESASRNQAVESIEQQIRAALCQCFDPRYPDDSIVELGFVDSVRYDPRNAIAEVVVTLSSSRSCVCDCIVDQIRQVAMSLPEVQEVRITIADDRPWRLERMKPEVRQKLGLEW